MQAEPNRGDHLESQTVSLRAELLEHDVRLRRAILAVPSF